MTFQIQSAVLIKEKRITFQAFFFCCFTYFVLVFATGQIKENSIFSFSLKMHYARNIYAASTLIVAQETQQSKEGGFHKIAQTTSKKAPDLLLL